MFSGFYEAVKIRTTKVYNTWKFLYIHRNKNTFSGLYYSTFWYEQH